MVSQSNFSPMASFVPKAQPKQAALLVLGLPPKDHICSGPLLNKTFLSVESNWFCFYKNCSIYFLILEKMLEFGEHLLLFNSF